MKTKRISQQQIAKEAGVSQKTVSNILRGRADGKVSAETCRRIEQIVKRCNYEIKLSPNAVPCRKNSGSNRIILLRSTNEKSHLKDMDFVTQVHNRLFTKLARQTAEKYGMELVEQSLSRENSAVEIDWEDFEHIRRGDKILVETFWNMHAAVALQKRGCHVAMLADETFWLHFYGPVFSRFSLFISETARTNHKLFSFLVSSGAKRIAVLAFRPYYFEPEHPLRIGYEQIMGLQGLKYRNTILMHHRDRNYREVISQAYQENPFDALVLGFVQNPIPEFDPGKSLHENLGLPEDVILFFNKRPFFPVRNAGRSYCLSSVWEKCLDDAVCALSERKFKPGIRYYEREICKIEE